RGRSHGPRRRHRPGRTDRLDRHSGPGLGFASRRQDRGGFLLKEMTRRPRCEVRREGKRMSTVLKLLRRQGGTTFALLDAARDPKVLPLVRSSGEPHQSLYEGGQGELLADFAPYLVELSRSPGLLDTLLQQGWGRSWGLFLTSYQAFKEVRRHFRRFLLVRFED